MVANRKPLVRMYSKIRARRNELCSCSHPYRDHRQKRSGVATVCASCPCVGFTPHDQRAWNRLLRRRA
jgi:hypothetical protein